jgi:hypothetical protein
MKLMTKVLVLGGAGIIAVGVGVFGSMLLGFAGTQVKSYSVKLVPQGASGTLKVDKSNKCNTGKHKGCLLFKQDRLGLIKFYLPGSKYEMKNCINANKVITMIELTAKGQGTDPEATKGDFDRTLPLPSWIKVNAFTGVDLDTGIVYTVNKDQAFTQALLVNLNNHDEETGERHFWYRVTVTDCNTPVNTWITDPRGDNEGTRF